MKKRFYTIIVAILLGSIYILISCEKNNLEDSVYDYRAPYLGDFNFTIYEAGWYLEAGTNGDSAVYYYDTLYYFGTVETYETTRLLIKYDTTIFAGIWVKGSSLIFGNIDAASIENPQHYSGYTFWGYYLGWTTPVLASDSLIIPYLQYYIGSKGHHRYGGYYQGNDTLRIFYSFQANGGSRSVKIIGARVD